MGKAAIVTVRENLDIEKGQRVVAHLRADEALDLAARLARNAFRRIAAEEGASAMFEEDTADEGPRESSAAANWTRAEVCAMGYGGQMILAGAAQLNDEPLNQLTHIATHLRKALQPALLSNLKRATKAYEGEVSPSGQEFNAIDEMLSWGATTVNARAALYYRSWEFKESKAEATKILREVLEDPNEIDNDDLPEAFETAMRRRTIVYTRIHGLIEAARATGMTDAKIRAALTGGGVSGEDVGALLRGKIPQFELSQQAQEGAMKKAGVLFDGAKKQTIRDRYRQARKMAHKMPRQSIQASAQQESSRE